ncbi:SNF2 family N-terminal domain-containing protein [Irpex rosettiformis]|uniref:SNF2 family N-terminal domain-containing protein n=1 Tax=Irpex rosettiformis TaxID=378272 RepID=A0ACB8UFX4_9APHY|nr:SNF2 family N-terminal domain-containing protein [Irpex rosettiformis]
MAMVGVENISGFTDLRSEDQTRVRIAISLRRVNPQDVPPSAKAPASTTASQDASGSAAASIPSQKKRKAAFEASYRSQQGIPQPGQSQSQTPTLAQVPARVQMQMQTQSQSQTRPQATGRGSNASQAIVVEDEVEEVVPDDQPIDELYVTMRINVVGIQYYEGLVGEGEEVRIVRDPLNKYDRNAIKIENISRTQVGHIPREIAAKLAPLMDRREVTVEGVMLQGNITSFQYSLAMNVKIFAPSDKRAIIEPKLIWATPGQRGFAPLRAAAASQSVAQQQIAAQAQAGRGSAYASSSYSSGYSQAPPQKGSYAYSFSQAGPSYSQRPTAPRLSAAQVAAQQEAQRKQAEAIAKAYELRQILDNLAKVDNEGRRTSLLDTLCSVDDALDLPDHPSPPGKDDDLKVELLKHQKQALQWAIDREYPKLPTDEKDKPVQFWQLRKAGGKSFYFNLATKTPQSNPPVLGRGALCADSMGLGKTLTMLALMLATKNDVPTDHSKSSLVVVPLSVLHNWEKQIQDHVKPGALTYCIYYGTGRNMSAADLQKYDVVITTYQSVTKEHEAFGGSTVASNKKRKTSDRALYEVKWKRIILDEGHTIRNPKTKMAKACYGLTAQRRWVLTGTPIINSPKDLGSLLSFLQICRPLDNEDFFKRMVLRPLKDATPEGAELLRGIMSQVCLHRKKEMQDKHGNPLISLPPVDHTVIPVTLTDEARELYDAIENLSKERVDSLLAQHGSAFSAVVQSNVLSMLTRLRQLALHPGLLPPNYLEKLKMTIGHEDAAAASAPAQQITAADKVRLQGLLAQAIEDNEECPICFGVIAEPRITSCAHCYCLACITEVIQRDPKCPMDRRAITMGDLVEPPPPTELTQAPVRREEDEDQTGIRTGSSAKIDQLIYLLRLSPGNEKSLVFSQFTGFLDKGSSCLNIGETLDKEGIPYVRFDGQMSAKKRQETIARFSVPIKDDVPVATQPNTATQGRLKRQTRRTRTNVAADVEVIVLDDDSDDDFVIRDEEEEDDFIVSDDDRPTAKKGKGKAKSKRKATPEPDYDEVVYQGVNPKVMLISLKAGALGLNLTVANNVYLMDPWWQEGIESQAIDRCNRIGQTKPVHVYQLVAEDTVESKVIDIQMKKKRLVDEAFSGIKSKQTLREKRQARAQELLALFGSRRQAQEASQNPANAGQASLDAFVAPPAA